MRNSHVKPYKLGSLQGSPEGTIKYQKLLVLPEFDVGVYPYKRMKVIYCSVHVIQTFILT